MKRWTVSKRMEIAGSHSLCLNYDSPCQRLHGHNWIITVHVEGDVLDENGMLIDFTHIKKAVHDQLDHNNINEVAPGMNPTAENIAEWCALEVQKRIDQTWKELASAGDLFRDMPLDFETRPRVSLVEVQESEGNTACYRP